MNGTIFRNHWFLGSYVDEIYAWLIIWNFFDPTYPQQSLMCKHVNFFGGKKIVDVHNVKLFSDFFSCFFEIFFDAFFVLTLNYRQRTMIQFFHNFYNPEIYHFRTVCNVGENRMMTPNALFVEQTGSFFVPSAHC